MTPAPPHLEYIITEETASFIEQYFNAGSKIGVLRSRPHTTIQSERDKAFREGFDEGFEIGKAQCETHHKEMIDEIIRASHISTTTERDKVLDSLCKIDFYWYAWGELESEDIGLCRGVSCNYCGRYNAELRTQTEAPR